MIVLSSPTMTLQVVLAGAVATTEPRCTVCYYDMPALATSDTGAQIPALFNSITTGTTPVDICEAYGSNRFAAGARVVTFVKIHNNDTASVTLNVSTSDSVTNNQIYATLATRETLYYEDRRGWYAIDVNGAEKTSIAVLPTSPLVLAYNSADDTNQTGNGATATVDFDTEVFDVTGNFTADTFTAPITGYYLFNVRLRVSAIPAGCTSCFMQVVSSNRTYNGNQEAFVAGTWSIRSLTLNTLVDMDAADTATVTVSFSGGAGNTATIEGDANLSTSISIARVG